MPVPTWNKKPRPRVSAAGSPSQDDFIHPARDARWLLAAAGATEPPPFLEFHRWLGTAVAVLAVAAAVASRAQATSLYRVSLFIAAALLPIASHLGGVLVWGADFMHL